VLRLRRQTTSKAGLRWKKGKQWTRANFHI